MNIFVELGRLKRYAWRCSKHRLTVKDSVAYLRTNDGQVILVGNHRVRRYLTWREERTLYARDVARVQEVLLAAAA